MPRTILVVEWGGDWITGQDLGPLELAAALPRDRYRFHFWCNTETVAAAARARGATAETYPDLTAEERGRLIPPVHVRARARDVIRCIAPDLIHCNAAPTLRWVLPQALQRRIPVLYHEHNLTTAGARRWAWLHQAHLVVGVSRAAVQGLLDDGMPARRVRVIHNGLDPARLVRPGVAWPDAARSRDGLVRIATLGSLIDRKGVDVLLRAFARALRREPRLRLRVGGDGPKRDELVRLVDLLGIAPQVEMTGQVNDLAAFFAGGVDLFASASRSERLNRTVLEAGWCGIPVVASDLPAHREALGGPEYAWFTPVDDVHELADVLVHAAGDADARAELGARLQAGVRARFTMERYLREFGAAYDGLLARAPEAYGWRSLHAPAGVKQWVGAALRRRLARRRPEPRPTRTLTPAPWRHA